MVSFFDRPGTKNEDSRHPLTQTRGDEDSYQVSKRPRKTTPKTRPCENAPADFASKRVRLEVDFVSVRFFAPKFRGF